MLSTSNGPKASVSVLVPPILDVVVLKYAAVLERCIRCTGCERCDSCDRGAVDRSSEDGKLFIELILRSLELKTCAFRFPVLVAILPNKLSDCRRSYVEMALKEVRSRQADKRMNKLWIDDQDHWRRLVMLFSSCFQKMLELKRSE